jgi:hypothetical protein
MKLSVIAGWHGRQEDGLVKKAGEFCEFFGTIKNRFVPAIITTMADNIAISFGEARCIDFANDPDHYEMFVKNVVYSSLQNLTSATYKSSFPAVPTLLRLCG